MDSKSIFARVGKAGIVCSVIMLAGCHEITGGGWIPGANGGKANFAFTGKCVDGFDPDWGPSASFYKGQLQYKDKSAGVRFHAALDGENGVLGLNCADSVALGEQFGLDAEVLIIGTCRSQPGKVKGTFIVTLLDEDGPDNGTFAGRKVIVQTPNPAFDDPFFDPWLRTPCTDNGLPYYNEGYIAGGTLTSHGH